MKILYAKAELWKLSKEYIPDLFIKKRLNFITIHYLYMIGWAILGSVLIFGIGNITYIDALFFASGSATQSGLNTVDVDLLHTGQQWVMYIMAMFCNPIFINSFVVFVRLYWFEKRFKDLVDEARALRRSKSRSKHNTVSKEDLEVGRKETGVKGKRIEILRDTGRVVEGDLNDEKAKVDANAESVTSSDNAKRDSGESSDEAPPVPTPGRGAVQPALGVHFALPLSPDAHSAFLQHQRNPGESAALRIPSPREFDRGGRPENVDDHDEHDDLTRQESGIMTTSPAELDDSGDHDLSSRASEHHITIDEPNIFRKRDKTSTFPRMNQRQGTNRSLEGTPAPRPRRAGTFSSPRRTNTDGLEVTPYLSWQPTIGRNSFFVNLSEEQREELGGIEYRALKTLALVLIIYFFTFHLIGVICLVPWILRTPTYGAVVTAAGQGRVWWGFFTAGSAFNDLGFTLTADSMIEFGTAIFPMLLMTFLIVIGNTGFPCMLRFVIWLTSKTVREGTGVWEELKFLLDHPRRCFTLLFPSGATWWLFIILVILNGLDLMFFIVLDLKDPTVTAMPGGIKFIDGLFQASSTRTAGFSVVDLADLHPAIQVSYLIMMYISVFPIAISMRRTNVYEEKSLGIYGSKNEENEDDHEPSYIGAHLRKQLSFDLWYVFLGLFIIAIAEGDKLANASDFGFTLFSVLFEIVSAYGTVGLSLGYPNTNASFSAQFSKVSKLVIIAMQIRGRHRGLPYELDRAILLPSESLHKKEAKEGERIMARRRSSMALSETSAVEGMHSNPNFRPETGLSSGFNSGHNDARRREPPGTNNNDPNQNDGYIHGALNRVGENHKSRVRSGLGKVMSRLAGHREVPEVDE